MQVCIIPSIFTVRQGKVVQGRYTPLSAEVKSIKSRGFAENVEWKKVTEAVHTQGCGVHPNATLRLGF